jgi:hypothetical protein
MDIEGFWEGAPDLELGVEQSWDEFVESQGGERVDKHVGKSPSFDNADYIFQKDKIVIELKEIQTEFANKPAFREKFFGLTKDLIAKEPDFFPFRNPLPGWFAREYIKIFRPPLSRILKKANKQIRETKRHFNIETPTGIAVFANEGFVSLGPEEIVLLASEILVNSYSSIDCFIYITVNRYVEVRGSNEPKLIWVSVYSDRVHDKIYNFVNSLGEKWGDYLEKKLGPFTSRIQTDDDSFLRRATAIVPPNENIG